MRRRRKERREGVGRRGRKPERENRKLAHATIQSIHNTGTQFTVEIPYLCS